ncbi:phosphodiesterase [Nocardioides sp. Kera G14]|uniref:phosphodiesterase n=1 Tax=Nocardioides sp. Kera G14 TaxID=2884264 RepID=UPI001D104EC9|nr:phosphodiesterase [Nocardioides sp. Kera G14]UDY23942.1 phosphodiesterase [Nocardioides sp. Kera G14]
MHLDLYPDPLHTIAHLSDTHLLAGGARQYGVVDPEVGLRLALDRLSRLAHVPDVVLVTGDLADIAEPQAYERLKSLVAPVAEDMGAELVWVMGNHDERPAYATELFGWPSDDPQDRVYDVDGLRVISLDSTVPGYHHGLVDADQLEWLREELSEPAEHGTIIGMHHPPIPLPLAPVDAIIGLYDHDSFAAVLEGTDVRGILAGHLHYSTYSTFADGIPVSVASASCYTVDPTPAAAILRGVDGAQSINLTHVYADRLVHTVVPLTESPAVYNVDPLLMAALEALSPEERIDQLSRKDSEFNTSGIATGA